MAFTLWFTGLPASGKTTLAKQVSRELNACAITSECLDSDVFVPYLGHFFERTPVGRDLNSRVMAIVASFLNKHQINCLVAATAPRANIRAGNKKLFDKNYIEVYCQCSLDIAEARDPKGLYRLARKGVLPNFTGIGETYDVPPSPDIVVSTATQPVQENVRSIMNYLRATGHVTRNNDESTKGET